LKLLLFILFFPFLAFSEAPRELRGHELLDSLYDQVTKNHQPVHYRKVSKKVLMGKLHLEKDSNGAYFIRDVYCHKLITSKITSVGPNRLPDNQIINVEHTWPQARFNKNINKNTQLGDLHHLFPTDSRTNNIRGMWQFAVIQEHRPTELCSASAYGRRKGNKTLFFEPPDDHKGNVARALFYFSVRYQLPISKIEESFLRQWHDLDPVDQKERERNQQIELIQHNRNPFIDHPEFVERIDNF